MITYPCSWRSGTCPNENRRTVLQSCKYKARSRSSTKEALFLIILTRKSVTVERHNCLMMSMFHYMMILCHYMMHMILCHYMMILCYFMMVMILYHYMKMLCLWWYFVIIWRYFVIIWWFFNCYYMIILCHYMMILYRRFFMDRKLCSFLCHLQLKLMAF